MLQKHVATSRFPLTLLVATPVPSLSTAFLFLPSRPPPPSPTYLTIHFSLYSNWYKSTKLESQQSLGSLYIISFPRIQRIILSKYFCKRAGGNSRFWVRCVIRMPLRFSDLVSTLFINVSFHCGLCRCSLVIVIFNSYFKKDTLDIICCFFFRFYVIYFDKYFIYAGLYNV